MLPYVDPHLTMDATATTMSCAEVQCLATIRRFELRDCRVCENIDAAAPNRTVLDSTVVRMARNVRHGTGCTYT